MVVSAPRRLNPYGPPPFFGPEMESLYAAQPSPYVGFEQVAGVGSGVGVGTALPQQQPGGFEPIDQPPSPQNATGPIPADQPTDDFPSEASIERRSRLAKALLGQQQEVHHPLQAVGNAVNQIAGAYLEDRNVRDQEKIENRRRDAYKKALSGGQTDLNKLADDLIASNDPALVDKGLEIKLQLATGSARRRNSPTVRDFPMGDQVVPHEWDEETGQWVPIEGTGGPRFSKQVGGTGGDGDGTGKGQQVVLQLPDGRPGIPGTYDPVRRQYYYRNERGEEVPAPYGTKVTTPSVGAPLSRKDYYKARKEYDEDLASLERLQKYMDTIGNTDVGWKRWTNSISANVKTLIASGKVPARYSEEELAQMEADGQLQGLLGLFRVDIVGPGVMTEYDALRVIRALGGDVSALQNPQVVANLLQNVYASKRRSLERNAQILEDNASTFGGEKPDISDVPKDLQKPPNARAPGSQGKGASSLPPEAKRPIGFTTEKGDKTFYWTGTGWLPQDKFNQRFAQRADGSWVKR